MQALASIALALEVEPIEIYRRADQILRDAGSCDREASGSLLQRPAPPWLPAAAPGPAVAPCCSARLRLLQRRWPRAT